MTKIIVTLIGLYLSLMLFAYFFSDLLTFFPPLASYKDTSEIIKLKTENGETLSAIYLPNKKAKYILLINHGNAEDLGNIIPLMKRFHHLNLAVFSYDYQGYGTSTGKPSVQHAYYDVNAAYNYLTNTLNFKPKQIIVYGISVGAALAIDLASRKPVGGIILQSPFLTAFRTLTQIPLLPFDKFNNLKKIKHIHCPVLVIHGTADKTIPFWQGKRIYKEANPPKQYLWVGDANHNNVIIKAGAAYWEAIRNFIDKMHTHPAAYIPRHPAVYIPRHPAVYIPRHPAAYIPRHPAA